MSRRLFILFPLLLVLNAGCHTWAYTNQPFSTMPERGPGHGIGDLRLQLASGSTVVLSQAFLRHDSLVGLSKAPRNEVAYAIADVTGVEVRKADAVKTAWAVLGITTGVFVIGVTIVAASMGSMTMLMRDAPCRGRVVPDPITEGPSSGLPHPRRNGLGQRRGPQRATWESTAPC